jgi:hypothetical protein
MPWGCLATIFANTFFQKGAVCISSCDSPRTALWPQWSQSWAPGRRKPFIDGTSRAPSAGHWLTQWESKGESQLVRLHQPLYLKDTLSWQDSWVRQARCPGVTRKEVLPAHLQKPLWILGIWQPHLSSNPAPRMTDTRKPWLCMASGISLPPRSTTSQKLGASAS